MNFAHSPVLLEECLTLLGPRSENELMIDATLGEGGHSAAFLSRFETLAIIGIDADGEILSAAKERLSQFGARIQFVNAWSQDFFAQYPGNLARPDTILIDLGVSLYHYEKTGRGFSFRKDEKLDMRIDTSLGEGVGELLSHISEKELSDILYANAQECCSRQIARALVEARKHSAITSSAALAAIVEAAVPASYRYAKVHPATRTFAALRIQVNGELERLPPLLELALKRLKSGGRLGVISFHSLEDKIVKDFLRNKNKHCTCPPESPICRCGGKRFVSILTRKGVSPGSREIGRNHPSRSARLRVAEKVFDGE